MPWVWAGSGLALVGLITAAGVPATHSAYSDHVSAKGSARAGVWAPDPPAACGPVERYAEVVWGTPGRDVFVGDGEPRIFMGLEGDDRLTSPLAADCLVGGPGRDRLSGTTATIVVGDRTEDTVVTLPGATSAGADPATDEPVDEAADDPGAGRSSEVGPPPQGTSASRPGTHHEPGPPPAARPTPGSKPAPGEAPRPAPGPTQDPPPLPAPAPDPEVQDPVKDLSGAPAPEPPPGGVAD
jgi:hypothetical protein